MSLTSYRLRGLEAMDANGPALLLADHHRSLQAIGHRVLVAAHCDDPLALHTAYRDFEHQVCEHMAAEEELILPAFSTAKPEEAAAIRADHAVLRARLERVAMAIELHEVRLALVRELLEALDEHARREDRTMYPWAQVHLPEAARNSLAARLRRSLERIAATTLG